VLKKGTLALIREDKIDVVVILEDLTELCHAIALYQPPMNLDFGEKVLDTLQSSNNLGLAYDLNCHLILYRRGTFRSDLLTIYCLNYLPRRAFTKNLTVAKSASKLALDCVRSKDKEPGEEVFSARRIKNHFHR
jgi:hypothetical protein